MQAFRIRLCGVLFCTFGGISFFLLSFVADLRYMCAPGGICRYFIVLEDFCITSNHAKCFAVQLTREFKRSRCGGSFGCQLAVFDRNSVYILAARC